MPQLVLLLSDPRRLPKFYKTVFGMETIQESANKVVLTDGVMRLVILNLNPNPLTGLYCYGIAAHEDWNAKLRQLQNDGVSVSKESDWLDESKEQVHLRDTEGNLVTVFGVD